MEVTSFVSAMMAAGAMSSCFTESPQTYRADNGTEITYCNYKGEKKYPGAEWTSKECEKCSCTADKGLKCCKAGQHHMSYTNVNGDSECVQKKEGCEIKWVLRDNPDEPCPKGKSGTATPNMFKDELEDALDKEDWGEDKGFGFHDDHDDEFGDDDDHKDMLDFFDDDFDHDDFWDF